MMMHGLVADSFGYGIIILPKNPDGDRTTSDYYRGITLSPVISKLFEWVLMQGVYFGCLLYADAFATFTWCNALYVNFL